MVLIVLCIVVFGMIHSGKAFAINFNKSPLSCRETFVSMIAKEGDSRIKYDLWVVGAGHLGFAIGKSYKLQHPTASIALETQTSRQHDSFVFHNMTPKLRLSRRIASATTKDATTNTLDGAVSKVVNDTNYSDGNCSDIYVDVDSDSDSDRGCARNVVICIPPSTSLSGENYEREVQQGMLLWAGEGCGGRAVFTSAISVYGEASSRRVQENSPVDASNPRAQT